MSAMDYTTTRYRCYVLGCRCSDVWRRLGRIHQRFGPVVTCPDHDPARYGADRPFGRQLASEVPGQLGISLPDGAQDQDQDQGDGGTKVPRVPYPSDFGPAGDAIPAPTYCEQPGPWAPAVAPASW